MTLPRYISDALGTNTSEWKIGSLGTFSSQNIDISNRQLLSSLGNITVYWGQGILANSTDGATIDWVNKRLKKKIGQSNEIIYDWETNQVNDTSLLNNLSCDFSNRKLHDSGEWKSVDWENRKAFNSLESEVFAWGNNNLFTTQKNTWLVYDSVYGDYIYQLNQDSIDIYAENYDYLNDELVGSFAMNLYENGYGNINIYHYLSSTLLFSARTALYESSFKLKANGNDGFWLSGSSNSYIESDGELLIRNYDGEPYFTMSKVKGTVVNESGRSGSIFRVFGVNNYLVDFSNTKTTFYNDAGSDILTLGASDAHAWFHANLGVCNNGTSFDPLASLHVSKNTNAGYRADTHSDTATAMAGVQLYKSRGTRASPTAVQSGDSLGYLGFFGYGATGFSNQSRAKIECFAGGNWSDTSHPTYFDVYITPIDSVLPSKCLSINPNGLFLFKDGTVGTPVISFLNDTDTGIYRIGANSFGTSCNGVQTSYWDTTGFNVNLRLKVGGGITEDSPVGAFTVQVGTRSYDNSVSTLQQRSSTSYWNIEATNLHTYEWYSSHANGTVFKATATSGSASKSVIDIIGISKNTSGRIVKISAITSAAGTTAIDETYHNIVVTGSTTQTLTILAGTVSLIGLQFIIKNQSTGNVTINRSSSDTFDGATSLTLSQNQSVVLTYIGSGNWSVS